MAKVSFEDRSQAELKASGFIRETLGLGMIVWGPEWGAMGRDNHTRFILKLLKSHLCSEFGAEGIAIGFFLNIEGSMSPESGKGVMRRTYLPKSSLAYCSLTIREEEAMLPIPEFKPMLAQKLVDASAHLAPFMEKKIPGFDGPKFVECVRGITNLYLQAEIGNEPSDHEIRSMEFAE